MRLTAETYRAPSRYATPTGSRNPVATVDTRGAPPAVNATACTLPERVPTNSVPRAPQVMPRAPGTLATCSMTKPGGSLMRSSGSVDCACGAATGQSHASTTSAGAQRCARWRRTCDATGGGTCGETWGRGTAGMRAFDRLDAPSVHPPRRTTRCILGLCCAARESR